MSGAQSLCQKKLWMKQPGRKICCFTLMSVLSIRANFKRLRQHVHEHLKPYVCLWENCQSPNLTFTTFSDWSKHMCQHHQQWHRYIFKPYVWICPICDGGTGPFKDSRDLFSHAQEVHAEQLTIDQLQLVSRQSRVELPRKRNDCPLCCSEVERP